MKEKKASEDLAVCKYSCDFGDVCKRHIIQYTNKIYTSKQQWVSFQDNGKGNCINYLDRRGCQDRRKN